MSGAFKFIDVCIVLSPVLHTPQTQQAPAEAALRLLQPSQTHLPYTY